MADGDIVPADKSVVRYARPSDICNGIVSLTAFERPEKDHDGLSVCQMGIFSNNYEEDLDKIRFILGRWRDLKLNGRLAELMVADIIAVGEEVEQALLVVEAPVLAVDDKPANPAHSIIKGLPFKGANEANLAGVLAGDLLARKVSRLHAVVSPEKPKQ